MLPTKETKKSKEGKRNGFVRCPEELQLPISRHVPQKLISVANQRLEGICSTNVRIKKNKRWNGKCGINQNEKLLSEFVDHC